MRYGEIADAYEKIEATTKRLEMIDLLVDLLRNTPKELIEKVVYMTQGKIYPGFVGLEIGVAEKLAVKALARASGRKESEIEENLRTTGDIGEAAQKFIANKRQVTFFQRTLTVQRVYEVLDKMARASGSGAVNLKMALLAGLLADATPKEAKYVMRTVTGNLRLGIADMTVLDALAVAYGGGKENRVFLERAYNVSSDLGRVAKVVVEKGLGGIRKFGISVGEPVRPMLCERLSSPEEILEKLGGKCVAEYKYDGERIQAHKKGDEVVFFSRRLEKISSQYPDAVRLLRESVKAEDVILEAECVAVDPDSGEMKPFQELMHRRRKYEIEKAMEAYPVSLFLFDALYVDGEDFTLKPYLIRRRALEETVEVSDRVKIAKRIVTGNVDELEKFFLEAIEDGCEGLVCKSIAEDSVYQAGARGWLWIKYKRDYKSEMTDAVDLVVVGSFYGRGKRAGIYGALLLAAYNSKKDVFETVTKCGTGFTDEDLAELPKMLRKHKTANKYPRVRSMINADVWFEPAVVIEILGAETTLSPVHVCAMDVIRRGSGLAIRFPRFTGNYRFDKSAEDATTSAEIVGMYRNQLKKIGA
ncbi:ATP-dependent DNA ligase [Candidatus Bathyarchaeota archaeon]|nr:ATP-dependent DNA ligase [Candidatus Bathyarchaeota archaeon]